MSEKSQAECSTDRKNTSHPSMAVPENSFMYVGPAATESNSLYRCVKCPDGKQTISCQDKSRQNLKKHIMVSCRFWM